jgi:hypothetical protein
LTDRGADEATRSQAVLLEDSAAVVPQGPEGSAVLTLLYLHGLPSGDFAPALEQLLGSAAGMSPAKTAAISLRGQRTLMEPEPLHERMPDALEPTDSTDQASPSCHTGTCDVGVAASPSIEGAPHPADRR